MLSSVVPVQPVRRPGEVPGLPNGRGGRTRELFARILDPIEQFSVPGGQPDGLERGQDRPFSLESGSPPAYDAGSMIDEREMSVEVNGPSGFENA